MNPFQLLLTACAIVTALLALEGTADLHGRRGVGPRRIPPSTLIQAQPQGTVVNFTTVANAKRQQPSGPRTHAELSRI